MDGLDLPINWTFFSTKNVKSIRVEQFASSQATQILNNEMKGDKLLSDARLFPDSFPTCIMEITDVEP